MKTFLVALCILLSLSLSANSVLDSTICNSAKELSVLSSLQKGGAVSPLDLYMIPNYDSTVHANIPDKVSRMYAMLDGFSIENKNIKQQLKIIYKQIHATYLKRYDEKALFNDIFKNGYYNCVTASALYSLALDHFGIPYQIKYTPNHVYIIADPAGIQFRIETTQPTNGMVQYDEKYQREFVNYLVKNKIVSEHEQKTQSVHSLFVKYHDKNETASIEQLASYQYHNIGVFAMNDGRFADAARAFEKSYLLNNVNTTGFLLNACLGSLLDEQRLSKQYDGNTLAKFANKNVKSTDDFSYAINYFLVVSDELMINHPDKVLYSRFFEDFKKEISDSIDVAEFDQTYYLCLGYNSYANNKFEDALEYLNLSYLSNIENVRVKQLVQDAGTRYLFVDKNHDELVDKFEYYFQVFPFLGETASFQQYLSHCYMRIIYDSFRYGEIAKGLQYLTRFQETVADFLAFEVNEQSIETAFSEIAMHYVQKGSYSKALDYLAIGLSYVPESRELLRRCDNIKEYERTPVTYSKPSGELPSLDPKALKVAFDKQFNESFPGCWQASALVENGEKIELGSDDQIQFDATKSKKMTFSDGEQPFAGRWAKRKNSRLLYFVPADNEDDYLLFKIVNIDGNFLQLRPYEDNKLTDSVIIFDRCD